ncbi:MAG: HEAT repeat domain-containing protein [Myxococcales bacterium]|nr:HEAT repeat domain-containing protein [Myxococcales bacterium]
MRDARGASRDLVRIEATRELARYAASEDPEERAVSIAALIEGLADKVAAVRGESALALADAKAEGARDALLEAARDENQRVRQMALVALGELAEPGDARVAKELRRAFSTDSPELRYQALIGLARVVPDDDVPLVRCLTDDDVQIRYIALRLCEERYEERELPHQIALRAERALKDEDTHVRVAAAIWLTKREHQAAGQVLVEALNSFRSRLSAEDEIAAVDLAGTQRLEAARPGLERRAFGLFGGPAVWQARVGLALLGDTRAKERLMRGLRSWSRDTRTHAVVAVGRARLEEARGLLESLRASESVDAALVGEALAELSAGESA